MSVSPALLGELANIVRIRTWRSSETEYTEFMSMEILPNHPNGVLIAHLSADFTPPEASALAADTTASYSSKFESEARPEEAVAARLASADSQQLGNEVATLLEPARITASFRDFIVAAVRQAHAHERVVSDEVAPDKLGLSGDGPDIFSRANAPLIEAQFLRVRLHDIIKRYVVTDQAENQEPTYVILSPSRYSEERYALNHWLMDYLTSYDQNPFETTDMTAYTMATVPAKVVEAPT